MRPRSVHRIADGSLKVSHSRYFRINCTNSKCKNEIGINQRESEWGVIVRNCFECYARVQYDLDKKEVESFVIDPPLDLEASKIELNGGGERHATCPGCGYLLTLQGHANSRGEELTYCPRCTKLIR